MNQLEAWLSSFPVVSFYCSSKTGGWRRRGEGVERQKGHASGLHSVLSTLFFFFFFSLFFFGVFYFHRLKKKSSDVSLLSFFQKGN